MTEELTIYQVANDYVKNGLDIFTSNYPPPVWVIPGLLPVGLTIFGGRPKVGKSWLAMQIAGAVASGGRVFGQQVEPGRVLYLALEDYEQRIQLRMKQQKWTQEAAANTDWVTMDTFRQKYGALQKTGWTRLVEIIGTGDYKLTVIDTLSRAFIGLRDIDNNQEVTEALSPLQETAITAPFSLLALDHHKKPNGNNPDPIDDILGSTAKAAVLDTAMGLYRDPEKSAYRLIAQGRDIEQADFILRFDNLTGCWQKEGNTDEYIHAANERKVLNALRQLEGTADLDSIAKAAEIAKTHASSNLSKLAEKGLVEKITDSKGLTLAYRLKSV